MVNQQSVRARINSGLDKSQTGCHARSDGLNLGASFNLQTIRAMVFEALGLKQTIAKRQQCSALGHVSVVLPEL
jgi:hypothetical protein